MADTDAPSRAVALTADEAGLLAALRGGDENAFTGLIEDYHPAMVRLAMHYVPSRAVAEEVAQEAWLAVLQGLDGFEGRSSLKTWIFRILMNRAMSRGQREHRSLPFSALFDPAKEPPEPAVDPDRFRGSHDRWPGGWARFPDSWEGAPETQLLSRESLDQVAKAIDTLPPSQREVIVLRDIQGWTSKEVCNVLDITETNQRVLLHRARSKVRRALEKYLDERV
jgi:RNA polymerase sigma-70 factor (ECF subfamily)